MFAPVVFILIGLDVVHSNTSINYNKDRSSPTKVSHRYKFLHRSRYLQLGDSNIDTLNETFSGMSSVPSTSPSTQFYDKTGVPSSTVTSPPTLSPSSSLTYSPSLPTRLPSSSLTYAPSYTRVVTGEPTVATPTAAATDMNHMGSHSQPTSRTKEPHPSLPTTFPSPSTNISKDDSNTTNKTLAISLPVVCTLILLLFGASVKWSRTQRIHDSRKASTTMMLLEKALDSPSSKETITQEGGRAKVKKVQQTAASPSTSTDLHLLETLSSESEESNGSPIWIQMSEYGPDDTGISPLDELDSRCGDWYDDFSCNCTISSVKSV